MGRYWAEEPWGPFRDNLHAGIIAAEIRRANFKGKVTVADFMVVSPEKRDQSFDRKGFFDFFRSIAKGKKGGPGPTPGPKMSAGKRK